MNAFQQAVFNERVQQEQKWGKHRHRWGDWVAILGEEYGEVCEAAVTLTFMGEGADADLRHLYHELVQVAAVAEAIAEHIAEVRSQ